MAVGPIQAATNQAFSIVGTLAGVARGVADLQKTKKSASATAKELRVEDKDKPLLKDLTRENARGRITQLYESLEEHKKKFADETTALKSTLEKQAQDIREWKKEADIQTEIGIKTGEGGVMKDLLERIQKHAESGEPFTLEGIYDVDEATAKEYDIPSTAEAEAKLRESGDWYAEIIRNEEPKQFTGFNKQSEAANESLLKAQQQKLIQNDMRTGGKY
jgi:hypothetical protein